MKRATRTLILGACGWLAATLAWPMDIVWTRMIGQWPGEASPLVADVSDKGQPEIFIVNRGGQLLRWAPDGTALGAGQDGLVAQLPAGRWTTAPMLVEVTNEARFIVGNVEGLIVGLNRDFRILWQHQLPSETSWGKAAAGTLPTDAGVAFCFGDQSGTLTCLSAAGRVLWTNALGAGPIRVPPQTWMMNGQPPAVLAAAGSSLFCVERGGQVRWRRDLRQEIQTRPEVFSAPNRHLIMCGTGGGTLAALDPRGEVLWECTLGDAPLSTLGWLPGRRAGPLILCAGLWGNLHAVDTQGQRVWTHLFRAKVRAVPVVLDANSDGRWEIYLPTFHQHLYVFDEDGNLADDVRLSGIIPSSAIPIVDPATGRTDVLVATSTLLAYRLRPGEPTSPYGQTGEPGGVTLRPPSRQPAERTPALLVNNPHGALLRVNLAMTSEGDWTLVQGRLTSRSAFELPLPAMVSTGAWTLHAAACDSQGNVVTQTTWRVPPHPGAASQRQTQDTLRAWATPAYGLFEATRLAPSAHEPASASQAGVVVESLYQGEVDQGAFLIASTLADAVRARVTIAGLTNAQGQAFGGTLVFCEVVPTGSVNGERIPDALPGLGDGGLVTIPSQRAVKVWVGVDAHGAQPGNYHGRITVAPLHAEAARIELPLGIEVLPLTMPKEFPLKLCTWDYVPNRWFPDARPALDDMGRHGVNVFPRTTCIPRAESNAQGDLIMDWSALDAELARLKGRGTILFQLTHPPIAFIATISEAEKRRAEIQYLHAFRDHLKERGRDYTDYAFYPLDEPGLDYGKNVPILVDAAKLFREADAKFQVYTDPVPGLSWKDFEQIEPLVDVWAPNMRLVSGLLSGDPRMKRILKGKVVWSYECVAQVKSLSPLRYNRANAWRAKFFGLSGLGFWTHSTTEADIWLAGKTIEDEYALVYPGTTPVPSVRWEAARDGLEDVAAMALLEERIKAHRQTGNRTALVEEAEAALRVALCDIMELSDETFIESRDYLRQGDRLLWHTWTDVESFSRHRREIARLTLALSGK